MTAPAAPRNGTASVWDVGWEAVLLDLLLLLVWSGWAGGVVARATGRPLARGVLVGTLVPVVGPLAWGIAVMVDMDPRATGRRAGLATSAPPVVAVAGAAVGLVAAVPLEWLRTTPSTGAGNGPEMGLSAADTGLGAVGLVVSAMVLATAVAFLLYSAMRRRIAVVVALVAVAWLAVAADSVLLRSLDGSSSNSELGAGFWVTVAAVLAGLTGAVLLAREAHPVPTAPGTALGTVVPPWQSRAPSASIGWTSPPPTGTTSPTPPRTEEWDSW